MSLFSFLRRLRHGPLKKLGPVWLILGRIYRKVFSRFGPAIPVEHKIGKFGPFKLNPHFAFSDFESWGTGHNNGFEKLINAAEGKNCVIDIGGHIGLVTLPLSRATATGGHVYVFEPGKTNHGYLKQHLELNRIENVTVEEMLVGASNDEVRFFEQNDATGQNSVVVKKNPELYQEVTRKQVTLDSYCAQKGIQPDIIKVDVEGAELDVLRGAKNILRQARPVVFLSVHPVELGLMGSSIEELVETIGDLGYQCTEMDGSPAETFRLAEYLLTPKVKS